MAASSSTAAASANTDGLEEDFERRARVTELSSSSSNEDVEEDEEGNEDDAVSGVPFPGRYASTTAGHGARTLPPWMQAATVALFHDDSLPTTSSEAQREVMLQCLPLLTGEDTQGLPLNSHGLPHLLRAKHARFLHSTLDSLPAPYVLIDASRPWFFYWAMAGLASLGEDVSVYRTRLMETVAPLQNVTGGFGGGHGQLSHCAATYATILALACVDGLDVVDRAAMWHWLGTVKQADGGFCMAVGAEEDIRGAYCAMTILTLLNLPLTLPPDCAARAAGLETFTDGLGDWIRRCQTFEGGIAGAPSNEEHGAYAFCALACLSILDAPYISITRYLDLPALIRCLSSLQTTPEGGYAGRHNKLVDACYSHWVGGCWALIDAALAGPASSATATTTDPTTPTTPATSHNPSLPGPAPRQSLWNRPALIRYLLACAQSKKGGMRDKPSTRPDGYHTCYSLAGLSAAQNHYAYRHHHHSDPAPALSLPQDADSTLPRRALRAPFRWTAHAASTAERAEWGFDAVDAVRFVHPVFVVPMEAVERARAKFEGKAVGLGMGMGKERAFWTGR